MKILLRVPNLIFGLLLAFVVLCLVTGQARADETLTTWRAGDLVVYGSGCHDVAAILDVARGGVEASREMARQARCFRTSGPLAAVLLEWIDGPFTQAGLIASVWRVRDALGDEEYILLYDASGPHQAAEAL